MYNLILYRRDIKGEIFMSVPCVWSKYCSVVYLPQSGQGVPHVPPLARTAHLESTAVTFPPYLHLPAETARGAVVEFFCWSFHDSNRAGSRRFSTPHT